MNKLTEEFSDLVNSIIHDKMLWFAKVHGVNVYEGLVLSNAAYEIMSEILKPAKLPSYYVNYKHDSIKCVKNECSVLVKSGLLEDFDAHFSTYWGIANKELQLEKILILTADFKCRNLDEEEKKDDYNKKFILTISRSTLWKNQHPEWDYPWPT